MKNNSVQFKESTVRKAIEETYDDLVGGCINTTYDYDKDTEEYQSAMSFLNNPDDICNDIYRIITSGTARVNYGGMIIAIQENVRFLGKTKLIEMIKEHINKHLAKDLQEIM